MQGGLTPLHRVATGDENEEVDPRNLLFLLTRGADKNATDYVRCGGGGKKREDLLSVESFHASCCIATYTTAVAVVALIARSSAHTLSSRP